MTDVQCLTYVIARYVSKEIGVSVEQLVDDAKNFFKPVSAPKPVKPVNPQEVDELFELYPTKDENNGNRSTGKNGRRDKEKISKLLSQYDFDVLKRGIEDYIGDCKRNKTYIKNLCTFLNNFDPNVHKCEHKQSVILTDIYGNKLQ